MSDDLRRTLEGQRKERIARASRRLVEGESPRDIESDLDEIDVYDKLLAAIEPRQKRTWIMPALVAVVCFAVAGLLWSLKIPRTNISMAVETDTLRLALSKPWRIEDAFQSSFIHLERLSSIQAPGIDLSIDTSSPDAWLEVSGGTLSLQALEIDRDASVEV